jgi:flagellar motility protein MotE (MotC chaperone)
MIFIFLFGVFFPLALSAEEEKKKKKEEEVKTPASMLRAIEQRNTELDQKAKQLELKEYRLRILEQEVSESLKKTKGLRDEMAKIRAAQKAADVKREAEAKAAAARRLADEKAAAAKKLADEKAALMKKEEEKKAVAISDQKSDAEREAALKKMEEEEELLRKKEEERRALQAQQFAKLAKLYEGMAPEDAAIRLQNMKDEFALAIIPLMKPKKASIVLAVMDPIVAVKFTEKMGMQEANFLKQLEKKKK